MKKFRLLGLSIVIILSGILLRAIFHMHQLDRATMKEVQLLKNEPSSISLEVLYNNEGVSGSTATFTSETFTTTKNHSNHIKVYFNNQSEVECSVTLYQKGFKDDSKVDSFSVPVGEIANKEMQGQVSSIYYVKVTNQAGGALQGDLKVEQLK